MTIPPYRVQWDFEFVIDHVDYKILVESPSDQQKK